MSELARVEGPSCQCCFCWGWGGVLSGGWWRALFKRRKSEKQPQLSLKTEWKKKVIRFFFSQNQHFFFILYWWSWWCAR